ncbi:short-chain alcohol dehydrogenase [Marasmius sp. AFHP31]|nr:short-chain alcohol dehydrogenase [Marasmius sp. AFHP31]
MTSGSDDLLEVQTPDSGSFYDGSTASGIRQAVGKWRDTYKPEKDIPHLTGKVFFITGGTAGIGKETVVPIARHQPEHIVFTGRDSRKGENLIEEVKAIVPDVRISFISCDLASLGSVKEAASKFTSLSSRLDVLICNAGIMGVPPGLTQDGYEVQLGVNHLGHAFLIKLLLPTLLRTAEEPKSDVRIVTVSSNGHRHPPPGGILFDSLRTTQQEVIGAAMTRYCQSKLANALYASELARRYPNITSVSVHPGIVNTALTDSSTWFTRAFLFVWTSWRQVTPEEGAYNQVWASTVDRTIIKNGAYYDPVGVLSTPGKDAQDEGLAKKLWEWTEEELKKY